MKFKIITLGCKVNTYESEVIKEQLINNGFIETFDNDANIVIVNTCSVTNMADIKSRKLIRYHKKENKDAIIVVCGCSAQNHQDKMQELGINILIGNNDKSKIPELIDNYLKDNKKYIKFYDMRKVPFEDMLVDKYTKQTRAYIKIQDGCNNYCAYCIIPYMRGNIRSKSLDKAVQEAKLLVNNGHKEIVLTGIDTGSYGKEKGYNLVDLLEKLVLIDGLERIRLSSIEISELDDRFVNFLKNNDKLCDHLHISLQSGSDNILKLMNRKYNKQQFLESINKIREVRPKISITTDVIVGFPSETEEDFVECMNFCKEVKFSKIHVFPYSKRTGTKASLMDGQIPNNIKKDRVDRLIKLSNELEFIYNNQFLNKEVEVLIEEIKENKSIGHTSNYLKVIIDKVFDKNTIVKVKVYKVGIEEIYATC